MKNVINGKYRGWWELLNELPTGWRIGKDECEQLCKLSDKV